MEFYQKSLKNLQSYPLVSIPNGMEFYSGLCSVWLCFLRFNSQRDGILQNVVKEATKMLLLVSIPNGMEFYLSFPHQVLAFYSVSIPNGMEFYPTIFSISSSKRSFNSQRDGILPKIIFWNDDTRGFQFPTGWNSTALAKF